MFIGLSAFNITGFNRTFMELKYCTGSTTLVAAVSFNRTFMELKSLEVTDIAKYLFRVSIVPLWN